MSKDDEWMSPREALAVLEMEHTVAVHAICTRANAGLIETRARCYVTLGRVLNDAEVPADFWWEEGDMVAQNWRTGDFEAKNRQNYASRDQAFGVTFRRSDIEQMISPAPQGANGASRAELKMTTPTDGEWMSAYEAVKILNFHEAAASTICTRAHAGLIKARVKLFISFGEEHPDFEVPREFWWAEGEAALKQDWVSGDFETWVKKTEQSVEGRVRREGREQAFGVTFWRADV